MENLEIEKQITIFQKALKEKNERTSQSKKSRNENKNKNKNENGGNHLPHLKDKRENSKELKQAFHDMRSPLVISSKIMLFIKQFNEDTGHFDEKECKLFFDPIQAVFKYIVAHAYDNDDNDKLKSFIKLFGHTLRNKLIKWFDAFKQSKTQATQEHLNTKAGKERKLRQMSQCLRCGLYSISKSIEAKVFDARDIKRFIEPVTTADVLNEKVFNNLKHDFKNGNDNFLSVIANVYLEQMVNDFQQFKKSNHDAYWYTNGGPMDSKYKYSTYKRPQKIEQIVDLILQYCNGDQEKQCNLICQIILAYDRPFDKSKVKYGRVIDHMQFYFDMQEIRKMFAPYSSFSTLCCQAVEKNDYTFEYLIKNLNNIVKLN